ncbi:MAG: hypothetical protein OXI54_17165 [Chloroflexota bacterium]|nr:hypothetical protein [Chloroflexota bacterium]MDE2685860.1 hypothetical protein [Chloroflexota bacterium]
MNSTHHLERSQHYLNFVPGNLAAGDFARAAAALARSASHAATAAAVHRHHGHHSRKRLSTALAELVFELRLAHTQWRAFRDVYRLPALLRDATPQAARCLLRRFKRRVARLHDAVATAILLTPPTPSFEQLLADPTLLPDPEPSPVVANMGELRQLLNVPLDTAYHNHPIGCPGCLINHHPQPPHSKSL